MIETTTGEAGRDDRSLFHSIAPTLMLHPFRLFLAAFLVFGLTAPPTVLAQDDDDTADETVIETEDGRRIIIREEDSDGDRPRIERRTLRWPNRALFGRDDESGTPRIERHGEIIFRDENGDERRFTIGGEGRHWMSDGDGLVTDTTIDGKRVMIIRTPGGEEEIIDLDGLGENAFAFHIPNFGMEDFNVEFPEGREMRLRMFGDESANGFAFGPNFMHLEGMMGASPETRRAMIELERRSVEIASRLREHHDAELEGELDDVLEQLFVLRGQSRAERAEQMEEQAEELRQEAQEIRESLDDRNRDSRNLIEERKRELLGERGSGW